ncbi:hypothetical protein FQR65_LT04992 [Abscondita terminalis]|nr:hypothetical protein FQR65_LT04992 [Abscondita terminalis]
MSVKLVIRKSTEYPTSQILPMRCCETSPSVLVIGAGASGIAAASKLIQNGIMNVTVLEAEHRVGGRIHTAAFGDAVVDLGAQWSHGEHNNTMYELVKNLDLLRLSNFNKRLQYSNEAFDATTANQFFKMYKLMLSEDTPGSVGEKEVLSSFRHDFLMQKGAFSWDELPMRTNYERLNGNSYLNWNGLGHGVILDVMMGKFPDPHEELPINIHYGKVVDEVAWNGEIVKTKCSDKSEYRADHVIVTVSLGVLKTCHDSMFKPSLSNDKVKAIESLGIEGVVKVALLFRDKWWNDDDFRMCLLCWDGDDLKKIPEDKLWVENLCELHIVEKNPRVLIAWFTGEFVPEVETLPDDAIVEGVTFVLKKFFGAKYNVTEPIRILRHNWYSNPHFRGVYSFETVASQQGEGAARLSEPLMSVLER